MAGKIFINYRRDDSAGTAGRLCDWLRRAFGPKNLFMDVDTIPAGVDFVDYLNSQVAACDVFLAVIGPNWLNAKDDSGHRRLDDPDDLLRIEIAAALARNIRVIPVLVDGARTPKADELPDSLKRLGRRNAVEVRNAQFSRDAEALVSKVREALKREQTVPWRRPFIAAGAAAPRRWGIVAGGATALLLVGWIGLYQIGVPVWVPWMPEAVPPNARDADKAQEAARQRQAKAEEERKAQEAERQRQAKAEGERKATAAAPSEAQRKAEEAEREQLAVGLNVARTVASPKNWLLPAGNYANHRYSQLKEITAQNVAKLQVAWTFSTGVLRGHQGGPLVVDDVMYVHGPFPNPVFALDLKWDGKILWKYEPKQDPNVIPVMCCDTVNRGLAYGDGKIFLHQADTTLVALDAKTGKVVWAAKNGEPSKGETGTAAPMVIKDKVLVGISGGEFGVQCHMTAYDLKTGRRLWRAFSEGPDDQILFDPVRTTELGKPVGKDSSIKTWQGDQWKTGGGCTWGWISYDPQLNLIYYGSGNPSTWNPTQRPGDNKWSMTIFARDPDTGRARWVYQMTPHEQWGYDGVNEMILANQNIGGTNRRTLVHFDRNGFGYTLDRALGELLVAEKYDPTVNWATKVDMDKNSPTYGRPMVTRQYSTDNRQDVNTKGICPSSMGAKNQQPAAFSPNTGLFYVPTTHLCMDYEPFRVSYTAGQPYVGAVLSMYPPPGETNLGNFIAWDARNGKIVWSLKERFAVWSGALATAGDVVFYGTLEGYLKAVDANTGKELFRFKTVSGIVGNVMTYEQSGKQYVAVLSGIGGWAGIGLAAGLTDPTSGLGAVGAFAQLRNYTALGGQLSVFALP
jgi:lanthanide-dependent methanol dehydrogenase